MKYLFLQILAIVAVAAALQVAFAIFDASQSTRESFAFGVGGALGIALEIVDERRRRKNEPKPEENYGNAAKMRKALEELAKWDANTPGTTLGRIAREALAEPPRNCDLYDTLEEADYAYANRKTTGLRFSSYNDFES